MATLAVQDLAGVAAGGTAVAAGAAAAAGGDTFSAVKDKTILRVTNAHATLARTVTFESWQTIPVGAAEADSAVTVAALTTKFIVIDNAAWIDPSDLKVDVTYSDSGDSLTLSVLRVP